MKDDPTLDDPSFKASLPVEERCATCRFCQDSPAFGFMAGRCRRFPSVLLPNDWSPVKRFGFPVVCKREDWCGEYQRAEKEEVKEPLTPRFTKQFDLIHREWYWLISPLGAQQVKMYGPSMDDNNVLHDQCFDKEIAYGLEHFHGYTFFGPIPRPPQA